MLSILLYRKTLYFWHYISSKTTKVKKNKERRESELNTTPLFELAFDILGPNFLELVRRRKKITGIMVLITEEIIQQFEILMEKGGLHSSFIVFTVALIFLSFWYLHLCLLMYLMFVFAVDEPLKKTFQVWHWLLLICFHFWVNLIGKRLILKIPSLIFLFYLDFLFCICVFLGCYFCQYEA